MAFDLKDDEDKNKNGIPDSEEKPGEEEPHPDLVAEHGEGEAEDIHDFQNVGDEPGEAAPEGSEPGELLDEDQAPGPGVESPQLADEENGGSPGDELGEGLPGEGLPGEEGADALAGPEGDAGDDWQDGDDFDSAEMEGGEEELDEEGAGALGDEGVAPGEETAHSIRGQGDGSGEDGAKVSMKVEPHDDGDGHMVHFHDEVSADLRGDADYQHHATEWSKHTAGYHISKDDNPERAEAHRHAANLHARIGNALHAGADTKRERGGNGLMPPGMDPALVGAPGEEGQFGSEPWNNGEEVAFPGVDEPSPGDDALGNEIPAKPDLLRNAPPVDTSGGARKPPPSGGGNGGNGGGNPFAKKSMDSDLRKAGGPFIGPKGGKWADAGHSIPWKGKEHESAHHEVSISSQHRHRGKGGQTATEFLVHDPSQPSGEHYHSYTTIGSSPAERKREALRQHGAKHNIEKPIKHVDFDKRRRTQAHAEAMAKPAGKGKIKLATNTGAVDVKSHATHGNWAAHEEHDPLGSKKSAKHQVTHVPSGLRIKSGMSKEQAKQFAEHMHKNAGDALGKLKFGKSPTKKHGDELKRVLAAKESFKKSHQPHMLRVR